MTYSAFVGETAQPHHRLNCLIALINRTAIPVACTVWSRTSSLDKIWRVNVWRPQSAILSPRKIMQQMLANRMERKSVANKLETLVVHEPKRRHVGHDARITLMRSAKDKYKDITNVNGYFIYIILIVQICLFSKMSSIFLDRVMFIKVMANWATNKAQCLWLLHQLWMKAFVLKLKYSLKYTSKNIPNRLGSFWEMYIFC